MNGINYNDTEHILKICSVKVKSPRNLSKSQPIVMQGLAYYSTFLNNDRICDTGDAVRETIIASTTMPNLPIPTARHLVNCMFQQHLCSGSDDQPDLNTWKLYEIEAEIDVITFRFVEVAPLRCGSRHLVEMSLRHNGIRFYCELTRPEKESQRSIRYEYGYYPNITPPVSIQRISSSAKTHSVSKITDWFE